MSVAVGVYGEKIHRKLSMRGGGGGGGGASVWSPGLPLNCNVFVSAVAQLSRLYHVMCQIDSAVLSNLTSNNLLTLPFSPINNIIFPNFSVSYVGFRLKILCY